MRSIHIMGGFGGDRVPESRGAEIENIPALSRYSSISKVGGKQPLYAYIHTYL